MNQQRSSSRSTPPPIGFRPGGGHHRLFQEVEKSRDTRATLLRLWGYLKRQRMFLVVAVPYQSLADQWVEELAKFGVAAIPCYESRARWLDFLVRASRPLRR